MSGHSVSCSASYAGDYRRDYAPSTGEATRGWRHNIGHMARRRGTRLQRAVQENPLLVGAGAMMLGLACGLAVAETETENEWMGQAGDAVVRRAREVARASTNGVQDAAETVATQRKRYRAGRRRDNRGPLNRPSVARRHGGSRTQRVEDQAPSHGPATTGRAIRR